MLTPSRQDADSQLRTAGYEVLNSFVANAAIDSLGIVADLSNVILQRLASTINLQQQVVSVEDRIMLEEMQTGITSVILVSRKAFRKDPVLTPLRPLFSALKPMSSPRLTA